MMIMILETPKTSREQYSMLSFHPCFVYTSCYDNTTGRTDIASFPRPVQRSFPFCRVPDKTCRVLIVQIHSMARLLHFTIMMRQLNLKFQVRLGQVRLILIRFGLAIVQVRSSQDYLGQVTFGQFSLVYFSSIQFNIVQSRFPYNEDTLCPVGKDDTIKMTAAQGAGTMQYQCGPVVLS